MASRASFTVVGAAQTVVNAIVTLAWVNALAATSPNLEFLRWWCGESTDVVSKSTRIQLSTQVTSFPTMVGVTPSRLNYGDNTSNVASGAGGVGTSGINASGEGAGAKTVIWPDQFNNVNGWLMIPTPEERYQLPNSAPVGIGMVFPVAVTPLTGWSFGCAFREI